MDPSDHFAPARFVPSVVHHSHVVHSCRTVDRLFLELPQVAPVKFGNYLSSNFILEHINNHDLL